MKIRSAIQAIEARRGSRAVVVAASNLDLDLLPVLYDVLADIGRTPRLDVVFHCRGGEVSAARRIGLLLDEFTGHLCFVTPSYCQSAGTITLLAAREIVAGPVAVFSPIDPHLQAGGDGPPGLSAEDIRQFAAMAEAWFGVEGPAAGGEALALLCGAIFPPTLTGFFRATRETEAVCADLLARSQPQASAEARARIAERLLFAHHSHDHALTGADLAAAGLPVVRDGETEAAAWAISTALRSVIGGNARANLDEAWFDALVATRDGWQGRRRNAEGLHLPWTGGDAE